MYQGPRAQIDRKLYKKHLQLYLNEYPNLTIQSGSVSDLVLNDNVTEEEQQRMISKGASQIVKGVKLGTICILFAILQLTKMIENGQVIRAPNVIITTGTFLGGEIHLGKQGLANMHRVNITYQIKLGLKVWPAGRIGENPSIGLSNSLKSAGFQLARLKTGKIFAHFE